MREHVLISQIRQRKESAMNEIIDRYSRLLWQIVSAVLHNVGSTQDVEEVVADVFICLWQHPEKFDPDRGTLKRLLCVMARSRAIDRCRVLARHAVLPLEEAVLACPPGMQEKLIREESRRALTAAVNALEEPGREILLRRYYYEQKPRQIALAMGMTVKQVDNFLYRCKRQLRSALEGKEVWDR